MFELIEIIIAFIFGVFIGIFIIAVSSANTREELERTIAEQRKEIDRLHHTLWYRQLNKSLKADGYEKKTEGTL